MKSTRADETTASRLENELDDLLLVTGSGCHNAKLSPPEPPTTSWTPIQKPLYTAARAVHLQYPL